MSSRVFPELAQSESAKGRLKHHQEHGNHRITASEYKEQHTPRRSADENSPTFQNQTAGRRSGSKKKYEPLPPLRFTPVGAPQGEHPDPLDEFPQQLCEAMLSGLKEQRDSLHYLIDQRIGELVRAQEELFDQQTRKICKMLRVRQQEQLNSYDTKQTALGHGYEATPGSDTDSLTRAPSGLTELPAVQYRPSGRSIDERDPGLGFVRRMSGVAATDNNDQHWNMWFKGAGINSKWMRKGIRRLAKLQESWQSWHEPHHTNSVSKLVTSGPFTALCVMVICFNAAHIAYQANYEISHIHEDRPSILTVPPVCFLTFYVLEMVLKLAAWGHFFFVGENARWNIFDLCLVLLAVVEGLGPDVTFMRMLRIMKIGRLLRVLRTSHLFDDLRLMIDCLVGAAVQLWWSCVLLLLAVFMFALYFVQDLTHTLEEKGAALTQDEVTSLRETFGSVIAAMLSLLKAVTGGTDWEVVYEKTLLSSRGSNVVFLAYIVFFFVAFYNVITSCFVEKALKYAQPDIDLLMTEKKHKDFHDAVELAERLKACNVDTNGNNNISLQEFEACLSDERVEDFLVTRGIDIKDATTFFQMIAQTLDVNELDIATIVGTCIRIKGVATSIDLAAMQFEMRMMHRMQRQVHEQMCRIESEVKRKDTSMTRREPLCDPPEIPKPSITPREPPLPVTSCMPPQQHVALPTTVGTPRGEQLQSARATPRSEQPTQSTRGTPRGGEQPQQSARGSPRSEQLGVTPHEEQLAPPLSPSCRAGPDVGAPGSMQPLLPQATADPGAVGPPLVEPAEQTEAGGSGGSNVAALQGSGCEGHEEALALN